MEYYCKECKNGITSEEYDYSLRKYGKPLCRVHQQNNSQNDKNNGLSQRQSRYKEDVIKGRLAETLIEELFLSLGYNIQIKWFRTRHTFIWDQVSVMIDFTKGYGYIIEIEKMSNEENKNNDLETLRNKFKSYKR